MHVQLTRRDGAIETGDQGLYRELAVAMDLSPYTSLIDLAMGINPPGFWVVLTDWLRGVGMAIDPGWSPNTLIAMIPGPHLMVIGLMIEAKILDLGHDPAGACDDLAPDEFLGALPVAMPQNLDELKTLLPAETVAGLLPGGSDA